MAKTKDRESRGYGHDHRILRDQVKPFVLAGGVRCARCGDPILPGEPWDLGHVDGDKSRYAGPEHATCNRSAGARRPWQAAPQIELEPERAGVAASDPRWRVPWLRGLRRVPKDATWPRLMTVPSERAVGSLGPQFIRWAERRSGRPLRWWQKLVATRLLEVDADGRLVWETLILSTARQVGKSWLLRELCLWRIQQGEHFGEPQDVMHTGKDLAVCKEVQRPGRLWAKSLPSVYKVREVNGQEEIEFLTDGSRWMLRAKEAVYGYAVSVACVDEAWKVQAARIDEGLVPTMAERIQPQLWLVSTAHRLATSLVLGRRQAALAMLEEPDADLLIEWSAPAQLPLDDVGGWRLASPHWTPRRERLVGRQLQALRAGEIDDPDEPDPEQSFRAQWLNQWPRTLTTPDENGELLLPGGLWGKLAEANVQTVDPVFVAIEDDYGLGAAVAAAARTTDGRIEVDGWHCPSWDAALDDARRLVEARTVRQLLVGASMLAKVPPETRPMPTPAGHRETRVALALLRDLAAAGEIVHDQTTFQLDDALTSARVREAANGLMLAPEGPRHLIKAAAWAVQAAHRPAVVAGIF